MWASCLAVPTRLCWTLMNLDPSRSSPWWEETPFSQRFLFSVAPVFKSRTHIVVNASPLSSQQARSEDWLLQARARLPKAHSHLTWPPIQCQAIGIKRWESGFFLLYLFSIGYFLFEEQPKWQIIFLREAFVSTRAWGCLRCKCAFLWVWIVYRFKRHHPDCSV